MQKTASWWFFCWPRMDMLVLLLLFGFQVYGLSPRLDRSAGLKVLYHVHGIIPLPLRRPPDWDIVVLLDEARSHTEETLPGPGLLYSGPEYTDMNGGAKASLYLLLYATVQGRSVSSCLKDVFKGVFIFSTDCIAVAVSRCSFDKVVHDNSFKWNLRITRRRGEQE